MEDRNKAALLLGTTVFIVTMILVIYMLLTYPVLVGKGTIMTMVVTCVVLIVLALAGMVIYFRKK